MEKLESTFKSAPHFHCEKGSHSVPVCQKCDTCVLAWKIFCTKEWFQRISELSQRRFLVSILVQLDNLYLLHYFQNMLQTTWKKDFIYNRSRINLSKKEGKTVKSSLNKMLDKTVEGKMKEILHWFTKCNHRTKANYTLLLLQMCNARLLYTAANVTRVLFLREQNILSAESGRSFPAQKRLFSGKIDMLKAGGASSSLLLDLDTIRELSSGISKYRDFIRYLPVHLSKYILSMLDKITLSRCIFVSRHWATLTHQVKMDLSLHTYIRNEINFLQGSYTKGINPNYANRISVPIPKTTEDGKRTRVKNQKAKPRTKNDFSLWTAYQNQETQLVQMEERNIFCGTYNIRVLSETLDQNRVIHYSGGDLVAIASNRKIQLLDITQLKEIPVSFRGHAGSIRTIILCEEENFLLSGSYDLSIRYWDLKSGACLRILSGHQGTITCMDLYKKMLVSGARDCQVKEWDIETGKCLKTFKHGNPILATRISETYIVSSCERGIIRVWHIATGQLVKSLIGHEGAVKCLSFDQWHLLSGSADGLVMAWSMVGKYERCLMAFKHPKEVLHVALLFLRVISACADGKIRIYNFLNGNCLKVMKVNGRGDPVLSFFIKGNRMVTNTESNILMFQFENIKWQYPLDKLKQKKNKDKEEDREEVVLHDITSKSSTHIPSLKDSMSSKQIALLDSSLSQTPRSYLLLKAAKLQSESLIDTHQGKSKSPQRDKKINTIWKETSSMDDGQENLEETENKMKENVETEDKTPRKKSPQMTLTPDRFLLTVNALQKAHKSKEFDYPRRPKPQVSDAWKPLISYPRKVLSLKGKPVQHVIDQMRTSNPPTDVKETNIPLEIQKLQPNLKNSLHSPHVQSTIPQPMIVRSRFSGSLTAEDGTTRPTDGTVRSFKPLSSLQVIKPNRMLAPRVGTTTLSVKKERPHFFYTAIDPFRVNTDFMLLTVKEENEYREAKMKEYQAKKPTGVVSPEKARKAAWIRKIKGLPIDNFMKQGKIAAPELGQNVFI